RRGGLAPRCRLVASWGRSMSQGLGCSPIKAARELGSERRITLRLLGAIPGCSLAISVKPHLLDTEPAEGNTGGKPADMQDATRAYIAGFLDGDGSVIFQLVRRRDYLYGYQIRSSVCFFQSTRGKAGLMWLKQQLGCGYVRDRAGDMSDYTIVGWSAVR